MFLNCHTYYSFRYGTLSVPRLLGLAQKHKVKRIALTDINNTSGILEAMRDAPKYGVQVIPGIDFRKGSEQLYIGLAQNQAGFAALNRFLSHHLIEEKPLPAHAPVLADSYFIYPFNDQNAAWLSNQLANKGTDKACEHTFLGVQLHQLNLLKGNKYRKLYGNMMALLPVTFEHKKDFNAHRLLRAIDNNCLLSKLPESEQARQDEQFALENLVMSQFEEFSFLVANTKRILDGCFVHFQFGVSKNKRFFLEDEAADLEMIRKLAFEGALERYPVLTSTIEKRIEKELEIIQQKNYLSYFLIAWDIVSFARKKGFFYVGRGSGANSIVAYCLRITDVDPIDLDLYFERFINLYRESPPDFDLDFSWKDRDEVLVHIFERYGADYVCLLATYNTFQLNSTMRELGKVFGLPKAEIEELIVQYKKKDPPHEFGKLIYTYGAYLQDWPNHLSIHAGGVLISELPIYHYTATNLPPKGFPISHFDMHLAEDIGLYKFDILSQRGLGHIKDGVALVRENRGVELDIHDIPKFKQDEAIKQLLRTGNTMGCFYVESPAMRMLLSKLRTQTYLELVAASSIIRPGVARSGMMREYILRHRFPEKHKEIHPVMADIMPDTYGIMVYQEDVIKVAHYFAGLSLGEADVLRRGMSGKYRSRDEFQKVKQQFFDNCKRMGHNDKLASEVWFQIESFAGYSFAKGHSASFAVESYQSLYLKAYYPIEFMVGVVNNFGGFYHTEYYLQEAQRGGAILEAPCVNESVYLTSLSGKVIHLGFVHLLNFETSAAHIIVAERKRAGAYTSLANFMERTGLAIEQAIILIRIGAFRFTGKDKKALLWDVHLLKHLSTAKKSDFVLKDAADRPEANRFAPNSMPSFAPSSAPNFEHDYIWQPQVASLFPEYNVAINYTLPPLDHQPKDDILDQIELLGFPLVSPFELLSDELKAKATSIRETMPTESVARFAAKVVEILGYLVTLKPTRTVKGDVMYFGTFLDIEGNWLDTVHFPPIAKQYPFSGKGIYRLHGKWIEEFGFYSLEVMKMEKVQYSF